MTDTVKIKINTIDQAENFVKEVSRFDENVDIMQGRYLCDAKSILGIFSLNLLEPIKVRIHSNDKQALIRFNKVMKDFEVNGDDEI